MRNYKGYPTHSETKDPTLRSFNRIQTLEAINGDVGEVVAQRYIEQFTEKERKELLVMAVWIKREGRESVIRSINNTTMEA